MPATFTFVPSYATNAKSKIRVKELALGDGYSQRVPDGINYEQMTVTAVFQSQTDAEVSALMTFIRTTKFTDWFYWTPPIPGYNTLRKFVCTDYSIVPVSYNCSDVTFEFRESFDQ